jgi:hypothetical protein
VSELQQSHLQHSLDLPSELQQSQLQQPLDLSLEFPQSPHSQEQKGQEKIKAGKKQQGKKRQAQELQPLSPGNPCIFTIPAILFSSIILTGIKISSLSQQQNFSFLSISVN